MKALNEITLIEGWTKKKPDVSHLQEFGCEVWIIDKNKNHSKLSPKSKMMTFVGYEDGPKAIRYYDSTTCKIKVSRNYIFNANKILTLKVSTVDLLGLSAKEENTDDCISPNPSAKIPKGKDPEIESSNKPEIAQPEQQGTRSTL